ncbi:FRG domain-containing protein [Deinococcus irradiatisoli]|uniref:FRG domain-containing protein n=1 Tax=Deinococcus irradiatisoli TaxID=2202254 RepID=A0A2Z3JAD3_9DEIO|nr:FRG domain-containing protein [Deinococcus irradiatisoli]AWN21945.1 FRG domain-containing protein [Deinococcus irradiatisoli]
MPQEPVAASIRVASSWNELLDLLYGGAWNPDLQRFRSPFVFHGSHNAEFALKTSLQRLGGDLRANERHLLRNFRKYAHRRATDGDSLWQWLALGQHHGLPTRLLDFTYSPLVALHFATRDPAHYQHDAAVWMVNHTVIQQFLPPPLQEALAAEGSEVLTTEHLQSVTETAGRTRLFDTSALAALEQLSDTPFLAFLEPPSLDERIVQQFALFGFVSNPEVQVDDWLSGHPGTFLKVVVPARLKWQIRDYLDQSNINERTLFPGLTGLAQWLGLYYQSPLHR